MLNLACSGNFEVGGRAAVAFASSMQQIVWVALLLHQLHTAGVVTVSYKTAVTIVCMCAGRCRVCQKAVESEEDWRDHCEDAVHRARMQGSCEVCGISATSPDLLEQHLLGRKHQRRLAEEAEAAGVRCAHWGSLACHSAFVFIQRWSHYAVHLYLVAVFGLGWMTLLSSPCLAAFRSSWKLEGLSSGVSVMCCRQVPEYPCEVCNVVTSSEEQLAVHIDGKRHRKHMLMAEVTSLPAAADGCADAEELHCNLCNVTAPSVTHKQIHLM